ncbi:MAG TPA: substrate-binding domain-containing protein [Ktedonobacteraceae bacterium]|nr:substrate-binding domain-containing protein [Ktedonobacteraceae bacterium]HLI68821.1 substrate-binding domain-containing protein [Ktedonobacteraceae bacterium]
MHIFSVLADSNLSDPQFWIGVGSLVLSALAILVTIFIAAHSQQRKVLTYEIASNSSVVNLDKDVSSSTVSLLVNGRPVTNVRVFVIKLLNAGNTAITPQDYPHNPTFEFFSPPYPRPLISCEVQDTGVAARLPVGQLRSMLSIDDVGLRSMTLRPPLLNPRDSLSLRVLLMADKRDSATMKVRGQIKDGEIKQYAPAPRLLSGRTVAIGLCIAFVLGILLSSFPLITAYAQGSCALGSIKVVGSTSFAPTVQIEQTNYNTICPSAISTVTISSDAPGSGAGLGYVESGRGQIADSEIRSTDPILTPPYPDLVDHQVGVIIFALIVNKSLVMQCGNFLTLDTSQLRQIYNAGDSLVWHKFASCLPDTPIRVVERSTQGGAQISGTQASFAKYVLQEPYPPTPAGAVPVGSSQQVITAVANTPGAIGFADLSDIRSSGSVTIVDINGYGPTASQVERGEYPFWAIEHMYTRQSPNGLTTSFINYIVEHLQTSDSVINCSDMTSVAFSPPHDDNNDGSDSCQKHALE